MIFTVVLAFVAILSFLLNQYLFNHWTRHGFKQLEPKFFFGDIKPIMTLKYSMGEYFQQLYQKHKNSKILGIYSLYIPALLITDPKLVQDVLIRDFRSFHDRETPMDEHKDPLSVHLFNLPGQK